MADAKKIKINDGSAINFRDDSKIPATEKGAAGGVAELNGSGIVPNSQLPGFILDYPSESSFPALGETGKIYIDTSTDIIYRWSGTEYVPISSAGGSGGLRKIEFSIATADWSETSGGEYTASVTDSRMITNSEEFVVFTNSLKNLTGNLDYNKNASTHSMVFVTESVPNGAIAGVIWSFINSNGSVAVELVSDKLPVSKGGTDAVTAAEARTNLGAASASDLSAFMAQKGTANGLASLDASGLVPSNQLPSYVDDVLEYSSVSEFPAAGEIGKIYVATDTNKSYRWSGSTYVELSSYALATAAAAGLMSADDKAKSDIFSIVNGELCITYYEEVEE